MAEAIRAYLANPNYLKTVAPDVAARIRSSVNANPELSPHIQFNANGASPPLNALSVGPSDAGVEAGTAEAARVLGEWLLGGGSLPDGRKAL